MILKNFFAKKSDHPKPADPMRARTASTRLDADALDACVGGRASAEGVGCYLQSEQS